jgi:ribonuclease D
MPSTSDMTPAQLANALAGGAPWQHSAGARSRVQLIDSTRSLHKALQLIDSAEMIGLDIETSDAGSRECVPAVARGIPALVQVGIYAPEPICLLIDPLAIDIQPLGALLSDDARMVVVQNAAFECAWLHFHWGFEIGRLLDTHRAWKLQLAPELAQYDPRCASVLARTNLAALCRALLGFDLDKGEQSSLWHHRPLTPAQMRYAALDVAVLGPLARATCEAARVLGVMELIEQDSRTCLQDRAERYAAQRQALAEGDDLERAQAMLDRAGSRAERLQVVSELATVPLFHEHRSALLARHAA